MQASLDELSRMRDLVSAGSLPSNARDLIARIRGLAEQRGTHQAAPAPVSAAPTTGRRGTRTRRERTRGASTGGGR